MTRLADPIALALLALLIPAAWALWSPSRRAALRYSSMLLVDGLPRSLRQRLAWVSPAMRLACLALLAIAVARPQAGVGRQRLATEGVAMELLVDRSGSMGEQMAFEGGVARRIDVVRRVLSDFVLGDGGELEGRPNDLIGLVAFARYADTLCPLVRDPDAVASFAESLDVVRLRSEDGTAIGDGLALAAARLKRAEEDLAAREGRDETDDAFTITSKAVVLLTDGRANAGDIDPLAAAQLCAEWGIRVYAIGIGSARESRAGGLVQFLGSGVDGATLQRIAELTGGRYWLADDERALREVYEEIDRLEKTRVESVEFTDYSERFGLFAAAALALLAFEALLGATLLRRDP